MILADTSVWIDYFRLGNAAFAGWLEERMVLMHPFVLGELMLGGLPADLISDLRALPASLVASSDEVLLLIDAEELSGRGIGYVDAALLASTKLQPGTRLLTRDRRLAAVAAELSLDFGEHEGTLRR